jgi:hypothetical protein
MNPETIAEISSLMRTLTPEQIMKMQTLMHNQMAGLNVTKEMMDFESSLPANFREKMARITYMANGIAVPPANSINAVETEDLAAPADASEARLVILRSVQSGMMSPEDALKVLFS